MIRFDVALYSHRPLRLRTCAKRRHVAVFPRAGYMKINRDAPGIGYQFLAKGRIHPQALEENPCPFAVAFATRRQHAGTGPTGLAADLPRVYNADLHALLRQPPSNGTPNDSAADNQSIHSPSSYPEITKWKKKS